MIQWTHGAPDLLMCSRKIIATQIFFSILFFFFLGSLGPVWFACLKTENWCLKIFVKICVGEKMCRNA